MATATIEAPAKVNLTLEILGSRPDGYHELRSVVMPVSLFEGVSVSTRADDAVTCETRGEGVDASELEGLPLERQLAVKAVRAMQRRLGRTGPGSGVDVRVAKRVPIGAGMGGGSADAAGVLACLRALWAPEMPEEELLAAGAECGSDVPAMILGGAALMEGRGERVSRLLAPDEHPAPIWLVAVFPGYHVSTKAVYDLYDRSKVQRFEGSKVQEAEDSGVRSFERSNFRTCEQGTDGQRLTNGGSLCENCARSVRNGDARACARSLFNGLQETVTKLHPLTERFCLALGRGGALGALLTGSGSAVYGLAGSREEAEAIRRKMDGTVRCEVLQTLPDGVMAAHGPLVP